VSALLEREHVPGYQRLNRPLFALPPDRMTQPIDNQPENELVEFCESLFRTSKNWRDGRLGMLDRFKSNIAWVLNNGLNPYSGEPSTTYVNMIFEKCFSVAADLADSPPEFLYRASQPGGIAKADLLNTAVPFIWESQYADEMYLDVATGMTIYGTWYLKCSHDPRFKSLGGLTTLSHVPPWFLFPCPYATSFRDCPWAIEIRPRTVGQILADYGVKVDPELSIREITPEIARNLGLGRTGATPDVIPPNPSDPTIADTKTVPTIPDTFFGTGEMSGVVLQKELWIRDGAVDEEWVWDTSGPIPKLVKGREPRYPNGRVISWANGKLLYDRPSPYQDGEFPYVAFRDVVIPDFWFGLGEVHHIVNLQLLHDDTIEMMKLAHLYMSMGKLIVDRSTGIEEGTIRNMPAEILWPRDGTSDRIHWLHAPNPPAEWYTHTASIERWIDTVTGRHDVTRGINPPGVRSGRMLNALNASANVRIRNRLRYTEASLRRLGMMFASRVQQYWPSHVTLPETKPDLRNAQSFRGFSMSPDEREADIRLKVTVVADLERIRQQEFQKYLLLHSLGYVGPDKLVEAADLIEGEEVLRDLPGLLMARANALAADQEAAAKSGSMNRTVGAQRTIGRGMTPPEGRG
jgi:hypothetical protein